MRRRPRLPIFTDLTPADIDRMSRRQSASASKKPRARTLTPAQILQRIQPCSTEPDEVDAFARWFSSLHRVHASAVYYFYIRRSPGWFVAIDRSAGGDWGAEVCSNPIVWNDERNRGSQVLRVLCGVHGPFERRAAERFCETVRARLAQHLAK